MKILVGSKNPVKIDAAKEAFGNYFDEFSVEGISVPSGVPDQPFGDENFIGAKNRAKNLLELDRREDIGADYFVGIEGGISNEHGMWFSFGVICVMDRDGKVGLGQSPHFLLPKAIIDKVNEGKELGAVIDEVFGGQNLKQKGGAIGVLTDGRLVRKDLYVPGIISALIPFFNENLF